MNLSTLEYYINKEKLNIQRIFISFAAWDNLLKQLNNPKIYIDNFFYLNNIPIHRVLHINLNWATFVICEGDETKDSSYFHYDIEILTEDEKLIRDIIE